MSYSVIFVRIKLTNCSVYSTTIIKPIAERSYIILSRLVPTDLILVNSGSCRS